MTADIINLRRARKAKARDEAETHAQENRLKFGRKKTEKILESFEASKMKSELDGKVRDK